MLSDWLHFAQPPSWRITTCRMLVTDYAMYSQLPFVYGDYQFHRNMRILHVMVTGTLFNSIIVCMSTMSHSCFKNVLHGTKR
jgi:hypothetical protein